MKIFISFLNVCLGLASPTFAIDKPVLENPTVAKSPAIDADRRAAAEAAAAIEGLGANPSPRKISMIVFKAVRSAPASVLAIVDAAVRVSPQVAASEIVTAATAAIPNPWKKIKYHRLPAPESNAARQDGKQTTDGKGAVELSGQAADFKAGPDFKSGPGDNVPTATDGPELTLAEAIARTAFDAQPGLSLAMLQAAVDTALLSDPATLLRYIESSQTNTGVGDAGFSNYGNEPVRLGRSAGSTKVPTPNPPVVSR